MLFGLQVCQHASLSGVLSPAACSHAGIGSGGGVGMPSGPLSHPASLTAAGLTTRHMREQQHRVHVITALRIVGCCSYLQHMQQDMIYYAGRGICWTMLSNENCAVRRASPGISRSILLILLALAGILYL